MCVCERYRVFRVVAMEEDRTKFDEVWLNGFEWRRIENCRFCIFLKKLYVHFVIEKLISLKKSISIFESLNFKW